MANLWSSNTPERFWLSEPAISEQQWHAAIQKAVPLLGLPVQADDVDTLLALSLGEAQFGSDHWQLSSAKRLYYVLKPVLPRTLTLALRKLYASPGREGFQLGWPVEDRYARFQWEVMRQLLIATGRSALSFVHFWPEGKQFAFVLTHDIETAEGQAYVRAVADLDESFGFRSSFNFVPERYPLSDKLMQELRERGFEVGVHGLKHDGKLFRSHAEFMRRAERINEYLRDLDAVGFRSPLMMRHPEWLQALQIEYDLSFFDTDPFQPIPGGVMSIWPFFIGRFVELPYTLIQDCALTMVLGEVTPRLWLEKADFVEKYCGMVLLNTHPDYLSDPVTWKLYADFLQTMRCRGGYWHALPREVARWWRIRTDSTGDAADARPVWGKVELDEEGTGLELRGET
jgi:hypothetical protein